MAGVTVWADNLFDGYIGRDSTETAADGSYTLLVSPGFYWLEAEAEGYVPAPPEELDLTTQSANFDIVLDAAPYTLQGSVRDSAGTPVSEATVWASTCGATYRAQTDAGGAYIMAAGPGAYSGTFTNYPQS